MKKEIYALSINRDDNHQILVFSWIPIYDFMMDQANSKYKEEKGKYRRRVWKLEAIKDICRPCYEAMKKHENDEKFFTIYLLEWREYDYIILDYMSGEWVL